MKIFLRMNGDVYPAGQRQFRLSLLEAFAGEVNGGQGRGTHGVDCHAGAGEIIIVGYPVGNGRIGGARDFQPALSHRLGAEQLIIPPHHAHIYPDAMAGQPAPGITGVLYGVPYGLQKKPLLGIHQFGFPGRNIEKQGIEPIHII